MSTKDTMPDRTCGECHGVHPSEPYMSDFAICLHDPEFEPYIDDIIERQDFSRCQELVERKRFAWDRGVCDKFDPVEIPDEGEECSPELTARVLRLAEGGKLSEEVLQVPILEDAVDRIDWARRPVDDFVRKLTEAKSCEERKEAVRRFGFLIGQGNRAAFEALCGYLRDLPPPESVPEKELRIEILGQLRFIRGPEWEAALAHLLADDLFRTPSNQTTRGWYTEVFNYFERSCPENIAEDALGRILDSPQFSYRIKKRVRGIVARESGHGYLL